MPADRCSAGRVRRFTATSGSPQRAHWPRGRYDSYSGREACEGRSSAASCTWEAIMSVDTGSRAGAVSKDRVRERSSRTVDHCLVPGRAQHRCPASSACHRDAPVTWRACRALSEVDGAEPATRTRGLVRSSAACANSRRVAHSPAKEQSHVAARPLPCSGQGEFRPQGHARADSRCTLFVTEVVRTRSAYHSRSRGRRARDIWRSRPVKKSSARPCSTRVSLTSTRSEDAQAVHERRKLGLAKAFFYEYRGTRFRG